MKSSSQQQRPAGAASLSFILCLSLTICLTSIPKLRFQGISIFAQHQTCTMQLLNLLALASIAAALPLELQERQLDRTGITENEFSRSLTCGKVIFVWARGSTEVGNMVRSEPETKAHSYTNIASRARSSANLSATNSASNTAETFKSKASTTQLFYPPTSFPAALISCPS